MTTPRLLITTVLLTTLLLTTAVRSQAHQEPTGPTATKTVMAAGLNNPRGLAIGPDGDIYVAEAGKGGDGPCALGPEGERCHGQTGAVVRIDLRHGTRESRGDGIAVGRNRRRQLRDRSARHLAARCGHHIRHHRLRRRPSQQGRRISDVAGASYARLVRATASGRWTFAADLGGYEGEVNPTGDERDSNPYGVLALAGRTVVADAGANALNQVAANGTVSTLAVFPDRLVDAPDFLGLPPGTLIPMDTVPTSVARGPDGAPLRGPAHRVSLPHGRRQGVPGAVPRRHAGGGGRGLHRDRRSCVRARRLAVRAGDRQERITGRVRRMATGRGR